MPLGAFKSALMGVAGVSSDSAVLIRSLSASSSALLEFTTDLTSDYEVYVFQLINLHPSDNNKSIQWMSGTSGPSYGIATSTTATRTYHNYAGNDYGLGRDTTRGMSDSTGWQYLTQNEGNVTYQGASSMLTLYNPASTAFYKSYLAQGVSNTDEGGADPYYYNILFGGRIKTTSAITAVKFQYDTGNIDSGVINLYGMKV